MIKFNKSMWFMALLLVVFLAGCGGGGGGGGGGVVDPAPVIPGECTEVGPAVTSSTPTDGDLNVSISTADVLNDGKLITAAFSEAMDPLTIESATPGALLTFTIKETVSEDNVPGTVLMNTAGTIATFTTSAPLLIDTEYTVTITVAAESFLDNTPLGCEYEWNFTTGSSTTAGQAPVTLGAAQPYGVLAGEDVTLAGSDLTGLRVDGDVGVHPGSTCIGCTTIQVSGLVENGTAPAAAAKVSLVTAYDDAIGRTTNLCVLGSDSLSTSATACGGINNFTYKPGLYRSGTSLTIVPGATIVLDAEGDSSAVFIFQSASSLDTIGGNTHVSLANQAQAKNVFWLVESSATIGGTTSDFAGTIIALTTITVNTGTEMAGRALARNASVTVQDGALITVPAP